MLTTCWNTLNKDLLACQTALVIVLTIIIGFGMGKVEYTMSRLMAFDAQIIGTWGCLPEYYPQALDMVLSGKISLGPFVQTRPMSTIREAFEEAHHRSPEKRIILTPDF